MAAPTSTASTAPAEPWVTRLADARRRRQRYESLWAGYARLHTNAYRAVKELNDDALVHLPNGDQVKAGLVFSNIEQTMAQLEIPEIGVRATAFDYTRELGVADTHRESVVEQALYWSLLNSGLIKDAEESDFVKLDGTMLGHAINYTHWRLEEQEVETDRIPMMMEGADGLFAPQLEDGIPAFEPVMAKQTVWEGCQDEHISPLQFLADASCKRFEKAAWLGFERPTKLAELKKDPRYNIPADIQGTSFRLKDLYGTESEDGEELTDAVMVIVIWDKLGRALHTFLETCNHSATGSYAKATARASGGQKEDLISIRTERWPLPFSHPDDSPFSFYIPIPARDHPFGISQVEHIRNQAMEADKLRTRQANITRQIKRVMWFKKGRIDPAQLDIALKSDDMAAVGLDIQDNEKSGDLFGELPIPNVHPDIYKQYNAAEQGVDKTSGVSAVPGGGSDTATESEYIFQIGGARLVRKKRKYLKFLSSVAKRHRDYLRAFCPEGELIPVPDVDGRPMTLAYGRAAFDGKFDVEVVAGGGATAVSPVKQKMLLEFGAQVNGKFGPLFDRAWLRQMLTQFDVRGVNELMRAAMMGMVPPGGVPGAPPAPGFEPGNYTGPQTLRAAINSPNEG